MKNDTKQPNDNSAEFITDTAGNSLSSFKENVEGKFKDINYILFGVVLILIVMVATLIIDSFHINSATYKEYSEKIDILNSLRENNDELLQQNKQNQEVILQQQVQIIDLLSGQNRRN